MLMIKNLRFALLSMFMVLTGSMMAQKVTIDFNNDYAMLFPTLAGVSSSDSHDGDFTEATTSSVVDGVYVVVSAAAEGVSNANRIWSANPRLRMYSGTLTIVSTGDAITKMEITRTTNASKVANNNTVDTGTLTTSDQQQNGVVEWTGNANSVTITIAGNTQFSKIELTLGEGNDDDDDEPNFEYSNVNISETDNQIVLSFDAIDEDLTVNCKMVFDFDENGNLVSASEITTFPNEELAKAKYDEMTEDPEVKATLNGAVMTVDVTEDYEGNKEEVKKLIDILLISMGIDQTSGTLEDPYTVEEALYGVLYNLDGNTSKPVYVKGYITNIAGVDLGYGNAEFKIASTNDADAEDKLVAFRCKYLENTSFFEEEQINIGDEVVLYGQLQLYVKDDDMTPELINGYIYSLNGNTKAEEPPVVEVKQISVAEAIELCNALADKAKTTENYQVKGIVTAVTEISTSYGNATFVLSDDAAGSNAFTVFRVKGFGGEKIADENIVKVGDVVVVEGLLQNYGGTPELAQGGKIVSVNGKTAGIEIVSNAKAAQTYYNLAGQRVAAPTKGLYIVDGKKVVMK